MKKLLKKTIIILVLGSVAGGGLWFFALRGQDGVDKEYVLAERGNLAQEVAVTGRVYPAQEIQLGFERSGKIIESSVDVGSHVKAGQVLARINNGELSAQRAQAVSALNADKAVLAELERGARSEDIDVTRAQLDKAEQDLDNYYKDVGATLYDAFIDADNALRVKLTSIFSGSKDQGFTLLFSSCDPATRSSVVEKRLESEIALEAWEKELDELTESSSEEELEQAVLEAQEHMGVFKDFFDETNILLKPGCATNNPVLDTLRANFDAARTLISGATVSVNTLEQAISSQKKLVDQYQSQLNLQLAGTASEKIAAQQAKVQASEANVSSIDAQISKGIITSPINGVVTSNDLEVGQTAAFGTPLVTIMSSADNQIEANIPEADITKVSVGDRAEVTFDAYGNSLELEVLVASIDPAAKILEGVPTYRTVFAFSSFDERLKSGMTANLDILTEKAENIIRIPRRTVINKGSDTFVQVIEGEEIVEKKIQTGLRGTDGNIEIIEGLEEGDKVVAFPGRER